jgi:CheY-like chemotaxis protein
LYDKDSPIQSECDGQTVRRASRPSEASLDAATADILLGAAMEPAMSEKDAMALMGLRILLAEDNPTNQLVATQMLESLGAEVTLAVDGAAALEILARQCFDAALIDIEMPRVSGVDLIRTVRAKSGPSAEMPMIALTAYVMREQRTAIEQAGADGIIAKPILSIEKFGQEILGFMRQRHRRQEVAAGPGPAATAPIVADIDRAVFDQLWSSFDSSGRDELKARVLEDIGAAADSVAAALVERDLTRLRAATHVLVSVAGVIGAQKLHCLARRLNSAGHAGDESLLEADGAELVREAKRVLDFVGRV